MIKRATHNQDVASATWVVQLPKGAKRGRALAIFTDEGNSREWDNWNFTNGTLSVDLGIDSGSGQLEYEYYIEGEDTNPDVTYDDGKIVIHISNNNTWGTPNTQ